MSLATLEGPATTAQLRAAIYGRLSKGELKALSTGDDEPQSATGRRTIIRLETQLAGCRQYVQDSGYRLDEQHVYTDVHSAEDLFQRPELTKLRAAVKQREVDVVVVYCVDRLVRD